MYREVNSMASEYEYRFQGERYQLDDIPKEPRVYKNPWEMSTLVEAELNQPRTKIDLSHGVTDLNSILSNDNDDII